MGLEDILALQDEITESVVGAIQPELGSDPYNGQAMTGIAGAYFDLGDYEASLEWPVKAGRAKPNLSWTGYSIVRVAAYACLGQMDDARLERDKIINRHPDAA